MRNQLSLLLALRREVLKNIGADGVVCPNLTFLQNGGLRELHGLSVAFLAGR